MRFFRRIGPLKDLQPLFMLRNEKAMQAGNT